MPVLEILPSSEVQSTHPVLPPPSLSQFNLSLPTPVLHLPAQAGIPVSASLLSGASTRRANVTKEVQGDVFELGNEL